MTTLCFIDLTLGRFLHRVCHPRFSIHRRFWFFLAAAAAGLAVGPVSARGEDKADYQSRNYTIYSPLPKDQLKEYADHMDTVFTEYSRRFGDFVSRDRSPMPLYLFRTRQEYISFFARQGVGAEHSGGMFFVLRDVQGLATWVEGYDKSTNFSTLQHEGFHQFAHRYIGSQLPQWANEGLAEYFGDGIVLRSRMKIGFANYERLLSVQNAVASGQAIDFDELLDLSDAAWSANMSDPVRGPLQYAQSWSVVHFLIHGDRGSYREPFAKYLRMVSKGRSSSSAFRVAFRAQDTTGFRKRWEEYISDLEPDPVSTAVARMKFLARGMASTLKDDPKAQITLESLTQGMIERQVSSKIALGVELKASDPQVFTYPHPSRAAKPFRFIASNDPALPPRITAPGLKPQPTIVWSLDADGAPQIDVDYK